MPIFRATRLWSRRTWAIFRVAVVVALVVVVLWQIFGVVFHASQPVAQHPAIVAG